jgi:LPXTG-motif cell wall-anchored protein
MKRFALALLVMGVMLLGFGLLTASAQNSSDNMVTVTVTDSNVTVSPTTVPVNVPVTFNFTNNGSNAHAFVIERAGANNEPLTSGADTASFDAIAAGDTFSTTWTFTEAGEYQLAAYSNNTQEQGLVATFTVGAAQAAATATASPTAEPTATMAATTTMTTTTATTSTVTAASPTNLPTTGGETNWAAMLLAFGVAALLLGGALTFARRGR